MNREEIAAIYLQVSDELGNGKEWCWHGLDGPLPRFAALVAAAEREACAKVCDELERANLYGVKECAAAIRKRGEQE